MMGRESTEASEVGSYRLFGTTHWSVVLASASKESPQASSALEQLCTTYWYPLYVYVRRRGYSPEDAQDLTQQFFASLLRHEYLRLADPKRGRFRTFLLHALEHFLSNEWKHAQCQKRGGGAVFLSLDAEQAEHRFSHEPATTMTPERAYEKRWAITLLDHVLAALRDQYTRAAKERVFEELAQLLWGRDGAAGLVSYAGAAERLGMSEGALRTAMCRLRARCRELLKAEVAHTVTGPQEVDQELQHLLLAVSRTD